MASSRPNGKKLKRMDAPAIAAAAIRRWDFMQSRLAPIIGEDGFRVLFARSLHRARIEYPWLGREPVEADVPFATLKASLESQAPARAEEGSRALMFNFNELLNALIGKELSTRMVGPL